MGRLTLWGMEQVFPDLLEGVQVPGIMSRENLIQLLNYRIGAEFPYIQVPPMLQVLISSWFQTRQETFQRMYDALWAQYDPIENYDRKEDRELHLKHTGTDTDTTTLGTQVEVKRTGTETNSTTGSETTSESGTDTTVTSGTDTTTRTGTEGDVLQVSAYDSPDYVPREQHTRTPDLTDTRTPQLTDTRTPDLTTTRTPDLNVTRTPDLTDISVNSGKDTTSTEYGHNEDTLEKIRAHGNIGVTTNQQMITAEMEMRALYNLYDVIIQMFEAEFMSRVY